MLPRATNRHLTHALAGSAVGGFAVAIGVTTQVRSACLVDEPCSANAGWALFLFVGSAAAGFALLFLPCLAAIALNSPAETDLLLARRTTWTATSAAVLILTAAFGIAVLSDDAYPGTSKSYWLTRGVLVIGLTLLPSVIGPGRWQLFVPIAVIIAGGAIAWAWYLHLAAVLLIPYATLLLVAAIAAAAVPIQRRRRLVHEDVSARQAD